MKILVAGDFCLSGRALSMTAENISHSLAAVVPYLRDSDYNIVNLECSVSNDVSTPITKVGPHLHSDSSVLYGLYKCGFRCVALANNHFADYGGRAVLDSLHHIDTAGLDRVGAGKDLTAAKEVLYASVGDKCLAIINCCEHEFTVATKSQAGCNPLNPIQQYYAIQEAKAKADYVLLIVHGGSEHYSLPTPRMQETYRFFVDAGVDAVVNCHQHCYSGYEIYKQKPIIYGLGNFFFDMNNAPSSWNDGYFVRIDFANKIEFQVYPYVQCKESPIIRFMDAGERELFDKKIMQLNDVIADEDRIRAHFSQLVIEREREYIGALEGSRTKWERLVQRIKRIINIQKPGKVVLTNQIIPLLRSLFRCESHRDIISMILDNRLD